MVVQLYAHKNKNLLSVKCSHKEHWLSLSVAEAISIKSEPWKGCSYDCLYIFGLQHFSEEKQLYFNLQSLVHRTG